MSREIVETAQRVLVMMRAVADLVDPEPLIPEAKIHNDALVSGHAALVLKHMERLRIPGHYAFSVLARAMIDMLEHSLEIDQQKREAQS